MARRVNYQELSYWEQRYKQNICQWYQWLCTPNQISALLQQQIPQTRLKILQIGCGSSNLAEKMVSLGHQDITCLDFSKQIIKNKQKGAKQGITYKYHDILQKFPFGEEEFDVIIEKNAIDCLFCFDDFPPKVLRCMKQCYRILKKGGKIISISHGKPKNRKLFYRNRFAPFSFKCIPLSNNQTQVNLFVLNKCQASIYLHEQDQKNQKQQQYDQKEAINEQQSDNGEDNNNQYQKSDQVQNSEKKGEQQEPDQENKEQASNSKQDKDQQGENVQDYDQAFES